MPWREPLKSGMSSDGRYDTSTERLAHLAWPCRHIPFKVVHFMGNSTQESNGRGYVPQTIRSTVGERGSPQLWSRKSKWCRFTCDLTQLMKSGDAPCTTGPRPRGLSTFCLYYELSTWSKTWRDMKCTSVQLRTQSNWSDYVVKVSDTNNHLPFPMIGRGCQSLSLNHAQSVS